MAAEIEELYTNLNKLLEDICKFFSDGNNYDTLSIDSRKKADELIKRSKYQLQEISKITITNKPDEAYVDMERKVVVENDKSNIYSSVQENSMPEVDANPYIDLPYKDLFQDVKYGPLLWKTRRYIFFPKKKILAGIHDNWLLIYTKEKEMKPIQTFDLKMYTAKCVESPQNKNPSQEFELVSLIENKKSENFLALTHKDMLQWVAQINRCHDLSNQSRESLFENDDLSETYDTVISLNQNKMANNSKGSLVQSQSKDDDEESIYHEIEALSSSHNKNVISHKLALNSNTRPPDLPLRPRGDMPLPPVPLKKQNSIESVISYDPVISIPSAESDASFSQDDNDDIYESFVNTCI